MLSTKTSSSSLSYRGRIQIFLNCITTLQGPIILVYNITRKVADESSNKNLILAPKLWYKNVLLSIRM